MSKDRGCQLMKHQTKPTIMILGSGHLANWGADRINYRMDDVLAPKRQTELQQLAEQLARFKPIVCAAAPSNEQFTV